MTRIITKKYNCAYCGNELSRHVVTSVSSFFNSEDILECKHTFMGIYPKLYFCHNCGYIGEDLSKEPDNKTKEIINSDDYKLFMKIGDRYNPYFQHFLLAITLVKLERYRDAIPHYACSVSEGHHIFLIQTPIYDLLDQRDVDIDIIADNTSNPDALFVNVLITDCVKHIDYQNEDNFIVFHASIDALRRTRKLEDALHLVDIAMKKDFSPLEKNLLIEEKELCSKGDIFTTIEVIDIVEL